MHAPPDMAVGKIRTIGVNAVSLLTSDVVNRGTTFVVYALIGRYLGSYEFGQLALGLSLFYLFHVLSALGLRTFVTRELARDRTQTDLYLVNGSVLVVGASVISVGALALLVVLMNYASDTSAVILLLSLGLLPHSLSAICEAVFQAWERMSYIAITNATGHIAKAVIAFLLLFRGYGLYEIVWLFLAVRVIILALQWLLLFQNITQPRLTIDLPFCKRIIKTTFTFLGIDSVVALWTSLNIILLSKFAGEREVGLFGAASQLLLPVTLVYQSTVLSVFPMMCRKFEEGLGLRQVSEKLLELLLSLALPTAVGLFFLSDSALLLVYGEREFLQAAPALRIMVWSLIAMALTRALGQVLLASHRETVTLRIVAVNASISLVLGLILISQFGLIGAAVAVLATRAIDLVQHYYPVSKLLSGLSLGRVLWKPVLASGVMGLFLVVVRGGNIVFAVGTASAIYIVVMFVLAVVEVGGMNRLQDRYRYMWSE